MILLSGGDVLFLLVLGLMFWEYNKNSKSITKTVMEEFKKKSYDDFSEELGKRHAKLDSDFIGHLHLVFFFALFIFGLSILSVAYYWTIHFLNGHS
jgi:hypothetical protein